MTVLRRLLAVPALAAVLLGSRGIALVQDADPSATIPPSATIQSLAEQPLLPAVSHPWDGRNWLDRFYAPRGYQPAWTRAQAGAAVSLLEEASSEGLDAGDYRVEELRAALGNPTADAARQDVALTTAMLHYLADLRLGRVRSEYHTFGPDPRLAQFDPVELLRGALARNRLDEAVSGSEPQVPLYGHVKAMLARYRELAQEPQPQLPAPGGTVRPGGGYKGAQALHLRLVMLGDLAPDGPGPRGARYDAGLAGGVRRFQERHGLAETGTLDGATIEAINVPLAQHVRQFELTLERLRWLPDFSAGPLVAVDVPAYRLWAFDTAQAGEPVLEMRVIVGAAGKTPTPLFVGQMRFLEFHPYWNVPRSITLKEIIPKLESDPDYLAQHGMEVVGQGGAGSIGALRAGTARVRQRPGPRNALGALKFSMPNPMDIYLHSTPSRELFRRPRRDLSHGCIRVEQPAELAQFVLRDQPHWDLGRVQAAMGPGPPRRVDLSAPVPVVIFYATALAARDDTALFARDVYHRDPLLEHALQEHSKSAEAK
jgi:murein L,D-transpeptidase YcbB/YkuD